MNDDTLDDDCRFLFQFLSKEQALAAIRRGQVLAHEMFSKLTLKGDMETVTAEIIAMRAAAMGSLASFSAAVRTIRENVTAGERVIQAALDRLEGQATKEPLNETICLGCRKTVSEVCPDERCRACHVSCSWEDCTDGSYSATVLRRSGRSEETITAMYPDAKRRNVEL